MPDAPLRIVVCAKVVLDPEASPATLQIDDDGRRVTASGTPPVVNPYDTNALAAALTLRRMRGHVEVTVVTAGPNPSKPVFLKALAAGADRVLALQTGPDPPAGADGRRTAAQLASLLDRVGGYDLVLAGRQAADTSAGVVGPLLAGRLGLPLVTLACGIRPGSTPTELEIERLDGTGTETVLCALPLLATVSSEVGELPYPSLPELRDARAKPFEVYPEDGVAAAPADAPVEIVRLARPDQGRDCLVLPDGRALAAELTARGLV